MWQSYFGKDLLNYYGVDINYLCKEVFGNMAGVDITIADQVQHPLLPRSWPPLPARDFALCRFWQETGCTCVARCRPGLLVASIKPLSPG